MPTGSCRPRGVLVPRRAEGGFTLAAMVVTLAIMAVFLTVAVQTATFQRKREMEEELIFRGQQMVEGVRLFRARFGRFPLSLEEMYKAKPRCLRKKWVDPITGKANWVPIFLGQDGQAGTPGRPGGPPVAPTPTPRGGFGGGVPSPEARGPIIGVASRSCESSIKLFEGRARYCDWKFVFDPQRQGKGGIQPPPEPRPTERPLPPKRK